MENREKEDKKIISWVKGLYESFVTSSFGRRVISAIALSIVIAFIYGGSTLSRDKYPQIAGVKREIKEPRWDDKRVSASSKKRDKKSKITTRSTLTNAMSDREETKAFDREIEAFIKKWELTGGSFALMRNDKLLYAKGYGYANRQSGERCDAHHTLRLASASKLITATAIMKLIEQGDLSLSTKVFGKGGILNEGRFLELADKRMTSITIEHLLRHTSGFNPPIADPAFSNYTIARELKRELPLNTDDMIIYTTRYRLNSSPGSRYEYSNLGYITLGKVIEVVTGVDYEQYVRREILDPAGCSNIYIGANYEEDLEESEVRYYEVASAEKIDSYDGRKGKVLRSNGGNNVTLLGAAGGWVASPAEMLRFVSHIDGHGTNESKGILSEESIKMMSYDSRDRTKKPIGWATVKGEVWERSGSMSGTCTMIKRTSGGYTWIFVTNSSAWNGYKLSNIISQQISRSIRKVKSWGEEDLFTK